METRREQDWNNPPELEVRRAKTAMEDELLIKLGVKRENIEFHPLIKHQRSERSNTSFSLKYKKVKAPYREEPLWLRNAWKCNNVAMRQMSDLSRKGPRVTTLDVGGHARNRRLPFPTGDPEYHRKRAARFRKLAELLSEWRVLHQTAYEIPAEDQLDLDKLDPNRPKSTSTSSSSRLRSRQRTPALPTMFRIRSAKQRKRTMAQKWINMKREMLLNLKAAKLTLDKEIAKSEVRIYLTSTPDMAEEREFLAEVACPELRRYCEKLGMNCHVVDLRTGMDKLTNDLMTFRMCEVEMAKCRRLSVGPTFVCLVGEQLDHDLPGFMSKDELEQVREVVIKNNIDGVELLDEYYRLDSNKLSPLYELGREDLYNLPDPQDAVDTLKTLLATAMDILRDEGKFGRKTMDFYKWSICAKEVETGLMSCKEPQNQLLCFMRDSNPDDHDMGFSNLHTIITRYFENNCCEENIVGVPKGRKTLNYMRNFCNIFLFHVINLIERNLDMQHFYVADHLSVTSDLIQHVHKQQQLSQDYDSESNKQLELELKDCLQNPVYKRTIVICGDQGSGKSSFASHIATCSVKWNPEVNTIMRFLGRSLRTSTLYHTLVSICKQIAFLFTLIVKIPSQATLVDMIRIFRVLLKEASEEQETGPLVIILDGVENLPDLEPHHVWGLMEDLPLGVSLVLTVDREHPYLKLLKASPQPAHFVTVQGCIGDVRKQIIDKILNRSDKSITQDQLNLILKQTGYEELPLTITTAAAIATHWPSHTLPKLKQLDTPVEAFEQLIEDIENSVGNAFTKYVFSFLQVSKYGLADSELLHLILSESELLNQLQSENTELSVLEGYPYQAQLSKVLHWAEPFLDERKVEGETLKRIGHPSLKTAIKARYLKEEFDTLIHKQLASFFQYTRRGLLYTTREVAEGTGSTLTSQIWRNLRSIPYHLSHSSSDVHTVLKLLKETVFLNFSWAINEIYSGYLNDFMSDLKYAVDLLQVDEDLFLVRRLILNLRPVIEENPSSLATIVSQFPSHHSHHFNEFIEQSKEWMKQMHSAVLIPSPSCTFFNGSFFYGEVTKNSVHLSPSSDGLYLVSVTNGKLETLDFGSGEVLSTIDASLTKLNMWGKYYLTGIMDNALKTWDILSGKLLRKIPLGINRVSWFHMFDDGTGYFASDNQIKRIHVITGTPVAVIKATQQIRDAGMSHRTIPTVVTLHVQTDWCVRVWEMSDPQTSIEIPLEEKTLSTRCEELNMTNDGKYAVVMYEREAVILAILDHDIEDTLSIDDEVLHVMMFTRSHDHVFLASESGKIRGHLMNSGTLLFTASVLDASSKKSKIRKGHVTSMTTSEDDHFLLVGQSTGMITIMNIPSAQRIHYISAHSDAVIQLFYMTDQIHFQHLISLEKEGTAKLWNLQNILRAAREKLFDLMWDDDLVKEESQKIELASYYKLYEKKGKTKMFLNGPDVAAFYNKTDKNVVGAGHSSSHPETSWERSGKLQDCLQVVATNTAVARGDIIITFTEDKKLAWWDVKNEKLLSVRSISPALRFHRLRAVFFDQAACLITRDSSDKETITIVYGTGKKKNILQREKVLRCDTSADLKKMATVSVSRQGFHLTIVDINTLEEQQYNLHLGNIEGTVFVDKARVTLSKDLEGVLGFFKVEDRTLVVYWNVADVNKISSDDSSREGQADVKSVKEKSEVDSNSEAVSYQNLAEVNTKITKSRFYSENEVLLGSKDGDIYILDTSTMKVGRMFSRDGIVSCKGIKPGPSRPHRASVRSMYFTPDYSHLLTMDSSKVCVWNMNRKILVYTPATGDKMANAVLSRDGCFTLAGLTTGIVRLWANYQKKLLYSFRIPTALHQVALTPDNARVIALVDENYGKRVVVLDIKNIDDYLLEKTDSSS